MSSRFPSRDEQHEIRIADGVTARVISGERLMVCEVTLAPGGVVPRHSHPHEQLGRCLVGAFELEIDGERRVVRAGESYVIPGDVPHAARALEATAVTLDIFSPPRAEYLPARTSRSPTGKLE
jgi:quercetin dioxygenase-like cupin family protein